MDASIDICRVCNTSMSDPRILPCAHSFCLQCLEVSTILNESSKCPTCKMDFEIPKGGVKDLKKNEFISKLHEMQLVHRNKISCKICDNNEAIRFCEDCSFNLCASCLNSHKQSQETKDHQIKAIKRKQELLQTCNSCHVNKSAKFCVDCSYYYCLPCLNCHTQFPSTKNHQLIEIDSEPGKIKDKKHEYAVCGDHEEIQNLFCYDCNDLLCGMCLGLKHNGHNVIHISQYFDEMKIKLDDDIIAKEIILQIVAWSRESSENVKNENERRANELKKEIEKHGEEIKKNIDSVVEELKKNVDEKLKEYNKEADDVLLKLESLDKNINEHIKTLKRQLNDLKDKTHIAPSILKDKFEIIPKYEESFDLALSRYKIENGIESIFGKLINDKAETTYQFTVNVGSMTKKVYSSEFYVRQLPWCLRIEQHNHVSLDDDDSGNYLGINLICNPNSNLRDWSCEAYYDFKLISYKSDNKHMSDQSIFSHKQGCGKEKFIKMNDLLDPNNGYVKDGKVTFEVYVKADEPKGIS